MSTATNWSDALAAATRTLPTSAAAARQLSENAATLAQVPELLAAVGHPPVKEAADAWQVYLADGDWGRVRSRAAAWADEIDRRQSPHRATTHPAQGVARILHGIAGTAAEALALADTLRHYGAAGTIPAGA